MRKSIVSLAVTVGVSFIFILTSITSNEPNVQAQVKTIEIPKPEVQNSLTAEEKILIQELASLNDKIADILKEKEPKWKMKKKVSGRTSRSSNPSDESAKETFSTTSYLQFSKGSGRLGVSLLLKSPSSFKDVSESLHFSLQGIARGVIKSVSGIGDECVVVTDAPRTPSTSVNLDFIKDKILISVSVSNQSKKREVNVEEAKKIARIVDSVINLPTKNDVAE